MFRTPSNTHAHKRRSDVENKATMKQISEIHLPFQHSIQKKGNLVQTTSCHNL